jgi:hypothetical protein
MRGRTILGLDVAVDHVVRVAPVDRLAELQDVPLHELGFEAVRLVLEDLEQVPLHVLEHEVLETARTRGAARARTRAA